MGYLLQLLPMWARRGPCSVQLLNFTLQAVARWNASTDLSTVDGLGC